MFLDASAIIAILTGEPEAEELAAALDAAGQQRLITSVVATWEATVGLFRKKRIPMAEAESRVREFLELARVDVLPVETGELTSALQAFDRYGRHRYLDTERNSALNLADCFHYASAKANGAPILTKDAGFALTDIGTVGVAN